MTPKKISDLNIVLVTHTFVTGAAHMLACYLKEKKVDSLLFIEHPFSYCSEINSYYQKYRKGRLVREGKAIGWKLPNILFYIKDVIYTFKWVLSSRGKIDIFIGADNLNAFTGLLLKKIGKVRKVIFYTIDYIPQRFRSKVLNNIYHFIDSYCVKHCDRTWNVADAMAEGREKKGLSSRYREKQSTVPIGTNFDRIKRKPFSMIERYTLVYMGHLRKNQGVELIIKVLPAISKKVPQVKLIIIGTGNLEEKLKHLVRKMHLEKHVEFKGYIRKHKDVENLLINYAIGIAPYVPSLESFTYFADPGKPKQYMACGLPVVITRVPWIAGEVERKKMGITINYDREELVNAVIKLLSDDEFYSKCRKNAIEFASKLSWDKIYDDAFSKVEFNV